MTNAEIAERANESVSGKMVKKVSFQFPRVFMIEFSDGTELYVDAEGDSIELVVAETDLKKPLYRGDLEELRKKQFWR